MNNNEVLQILRDNLKLNSEQLIEILNLVDVKVTPSEMEAWLKPQGEEGHMQLSHKLMAHFLDALVIYKRGKSENSEARPIEIPITNNIILKKLRVAFELKEDDLIAISKKTDSTTTPKEWSAFFRKQGHKNYRACPDPFLESILKGLAT